jgi:hypothetical protein
LVLAQRQASEQRAVTRPEALERRAHGGSVVLADQALACVRRVIR